MFTDATIDHNGDPDYVGLDFDNDPDCGDPSSWPSWTDEIVGIGAATCVQELFPCMQIPLISDEDLKDLRSFDRSVS